MTRTAPAPTKQQLGAIARTASMRRRNAARDARIRRQRAAGRSVVAIAEAEGLTRQAVYNVLRAGEAA